MELRSGFELLVLCEGLAGGLGGEHAKGQIEDALADATHLGAVGVYDHALGDGGVAGGGEAASALDLHKARPAGPDGRHGRVFAQLGDVCPGGVNHLQDGVPLPCLDGYAVYGEVDGHWAVSKRLGLHSRVFYTRETRSSHIRLDWSPFIPLTLASLAPPHAPPV